MDDFFLMLFVLVLVLIPVVNSTTFVYFVGDAIGTTEEPLAPGVDKNEEGRESISTVEIV